MAASAITARAITQSGPWGPVYGPLDLDIPEGGLNVLVGPAGSGRTALLMTLGLSIKSAQFPFHAWLPDAHASATTASSEAMKPSTARV